MIAKRRGGSSNFRPSKYLVGSAAWNVLGLTTLVAAPVHWRLTVAALVVNHLSIVAAGLTPRSRLLGPNIARAESGESRGEVALTFDDGPDPEVTPRVLEILERSGVHASFFCVGERARSAPDLVREIAARGHRVENHSLSHRNDFFFLGPGALTREVDAAQEILSCLSGRAPNFFRAPAGIRSPLVESVLRRAGLRLVSWTRRGFDTVSTSPQRVVARLARGVAAGDILLLHDRRGARGSAVILDALPRLLDVIGAQGLAAAPLIIEAD